jgi:hypothetical protein
MDHLPEDHPALTVRLATPGGEHQPNDFPATQGTVDPQASAAAAEIGQGALE